MLPRFVKVFPHEYKRVLGVARAGALPVPQPQPPGERPTGGDSVGKITGFLEYTRELPARRPPAERINDWFEIYQPFPEDQLRDAGRALHGLRRALLPHRLPADQPHSRLERPGLPRPLARSRPPAARHQQLPRVHRPHLPRALRSRLRARHQRAAGHHQADREDHHRPRLRRGLHPARAGRRSAPASASPSSAPARRAWPPRSNWRAPATTSRSSRRPTASAACCATASRISRWRSTSSTAASSRCAPKACSFETNAHVGGNVPVEDLRKRVRRHPAGGRRRTAARPERPRPRAEGHPLRHGVPAAAEPPLRRRHRCPDQPSWPPASAW